MKVFDGQSANGDSSAFSFTSRNPSYLHIWLSGDLGGGDILIMSEVPDNPGTYVPALGFDGIDLSQEGYFVLNVRSFSGILRLQNASSADLDAWVESTAAAYERIRAL